jgi:stage V sporulation protein K
MSDLSLVAQLIVDKATSQAKRSENERVGKLHLLAGIRSWNEESFDARYPDTHQSVIAAIRRNRGTSLKCVGLEESLEERISKVKNPDDVWSLATELLQETEAERSKVDEESSYAATAEQAPEQPKRNESLPPIEEQDALPFGLTEELIDRISSTTGWDKGTTARRILAEAHAVASVVLGQTDETLAGRLSDASLMSGIDFHPAVSMTTAIKEVANSANPDSGRVATQLALALVEVAEWAAALDQNVTTEETDRIDTVRLALREQLGDKLNAESASISAFEEKFSHLIGMESVKTEIRKRVDFLVVNKRRAKRGLGAIPHRMHVAFVGNPGTGKTTVARLYGELLNDLGLLPTRNFVETDRSGLVAEYVGQTEKKTLDQINRADGGVLFIDECYALNDGYGTQKGFGEEATDCLVKQMEDRRERLVVILAGYKEQTLEYMKINPGLQSRVPMVVDFPDYSTTELMDIADRICVGRGLTIGTEARPVLELLLDTARSTKEFGNARTVENILETAERNVVTRTSHLGNLATERELRTITAEDIPKVPPRHQKRIGFGPGSYV